MNNFQDFLNHKGIKEEPLKKISKRIVDSFTYVDDESHINICLSPNLKCENGRTALKVDYSFLKNILQFNDKKIGQVSNILYDTLYQILEERFSIIDSDVINIIIFRYIYSDIYEKYYKPLINNNVITEREDKKNKYKLTKSEINKLLSDYEYMGYDEDWAKDDLIDLVSYLNNLETPLTLYRIICVDDIKDINKEYIGNHYSIDRDNLMTNHYQRGSIKGSCFGDKVFLITVSSKKSQIDVMETLSNNILFPHEKEITLKNKGYGSIVINIEEL